LEANHVIDLQKQLFAVSIGHFPDGQPLTVTYNNFKQTTFYPKLGHAISCVVESIPKGGILVFFPSYSFLGKCVSSWNPVDNNDADPQHGEQPSIEIWHRLLRSKGKVIVEPTKSQEAFEAARDEYRETIKATGSCILLAVFRGKMSEGISFNDDNARGVICVGMPYPNARDRSITAKKAYNDEQRKLRKKTCLLPGQEWYTQQASRAIAQALGRCIRHGADYGTVVLMDSRHCDDGSPNDGLCNAHKNLPKWMRSCVRTLSMQANSGVGKNPVLGGYAGLKSEMTDFFAQAPAVSQAVRSTWKKDLEKAKALKSNSPGHVFDKVTASWTSRSSAGKVPNDA
jgi:Fanconi anemia group J protein